MFKLVPIWIGIAILVGCASKPEVPPVAQKPAAATPAPAPVARTQPAEVAKDESIASRATTVDAYKRDLAKRIAEVNSSKVFPGRPQALLRSVVVVKFTVDERGQVTKSEIIRSNNDKSTESTALATLKNAGPFPKPAAHLLQGGRLDISETWLFNNDGRFQLRSIAEAQMNR